eukprot:TRINITY_DN4468_c0_g3_i1.p1 TRINITY_DN4468_c0_g3~~TRINITY_DN4468_c0_g3_i1.p1  ORF type:complete len:413 (-),score=32.95 TRINITY_DN4468_c0_g3_i1:464-1702(-)
MKEDGNAQLEKDQEPPRAGDWSSVEARPLRTVNVTWAKSHLAVLKRALPLVGLRAVESPCAGAAPVRGDLVWVVTADDVAQRVEHLKRSQWLSHVPGISIVCTKQGLAEALAASGEDFAWAPRTWLLPKQQDDMLAFCQKHPRSPLIYKPSEAGMGEAVFLMLGRMDAERKVNMMRCRSAIAQRYIERPLLLDGRKCDLRLYLLVVVPANCTEWQVFLFREGLVRVCAEPYAEPSRMTLHHTSVHLTNTSVSTLHHDGSMPCCETLADLSARLGSDNWARIWQAISAMLQTTMACCRPCVPSIPCRSFQIVGADVLLDEKFRAHLIEFNDMVSLKLGRTVLMTDPIVQELGLKRCSAPCFDHRPHAHAPNDLDEHVKVPLVVGSLTLVQRIATLGADTSSDVLLDELPFDAL